MARVAPLLGALMLLAASLSRLVWIGSDLLGAPRFLHAFAHDGTMPRLLGRVHPRTHTPWVAILLHAVIAIALALSGTFETLALLSALVTAPLYIIVCLAAVRLRARGVAQGDAVPRLPLLRPAMVVGCTSMIVIIALAHLRDMLGLALLLGGGLLWYEGARVLQRQARRPAR
jgi:amino acid transporter